MSSRADDQRFPGTQPHSTDLFGHIGMAKINYNLTAVNLLSKIVSLIERRHDDGTGAFRRC